MTCKYKKLAILGGTFDPIHIGHLLIAQQAYNNFELDKIIFMPAGITPHKDNVNITASRHRLEMVRIAIKDNPVFSFSQWEINQSKKSYTVDTLKYFEQQDIASEIYFIIGADSLYDMFDWKEPEYLLTRSNFIVAARPGYLLENIFKDQRFKGYEKNIYLLDKFKMEISSSTIREYIRNNISVKYLLPDEIINYINENRLYQG